MKIGILGGTFNPIHYGHLIQSELVRVECELDKIIFMPSKNPPHKTFLDIVSEDMRKDMVELAVASNPNFTVSDMEYKRPGLSYTVDTIRELKVIYPQDTLYLILGEDSLMKLSSWKGYAEILKSIEVIVVERHSRNGWDLDRKLKSFNDEFNAKIRKIDTPIIDISSSFIRERLRQGLSIRYLVPEGVEKYIMENKLYIGDE